VALCEVGMQQRERERERAGARARESRGASGLLCEVCCSAF